MLVAVAVLAACSSGSSDGGSAGRAQPAASYTPRYRTNPCPDVVADDARITCGTLTVPERRDRAAGRQVHLAVARIAPRPGTSEQPDPVLFLTGGPGDLSLRYAADHLEHPLVTDREVILVDLRGVGASTPSLACPELDPLRDLPTPAGDLDARRATEDAIRACRRRLVADGVDLRAYDYTAMSADLADLRTALHLRQWNVYGISNGGRLALELVRRHPAGIRSLLLDASLPPQGNYYVEQWPHADAAFHRLADACAADAGCHAAYPDVYGELGELVTQLDEHPVTVTVPDPSTGEPTPVTFDGDLLLRTARGALYETALIPIVPQILHQLVNGGSFELVATEILRRRTDSDSFSVGEQLSVNCREEVAFIAGGTFERQAEQLPLERRVVLDEPDVDHCRIWDVGKADPSVDEPVDSDIPALLTVGQFDPVHPRASADAIAAHLTHRWIVELPGQGHGVARSSDCASTIVRGFVDDPSHAPDTSCVSALPAVSFAT